MKYLLPGVSWATDPTYPAGALPWSGGPTKIKPSTGLQAGGVVPNAQVSAQEVNWLLNNAQVGLAVQAHAAMRSWQSALHGLGGAGALDIVGVRSLSARFTAAMNDRQRFISVFGPNSGDANKSWSTISADADIWFAQGRITGTGIASGMAYLFTVPGEPGVVILCNGAVVAVSADQGTTWATNTNYTNLNSLGAHWAPGGGGTYVFVDTDGLVRVASSLSASTSHAISGVTTFGSVASGNYAEFADDGNTTIVFICRHDSSTFFSAFTFTDSGATWTKTQDLAGTHASITYNKALGVFFLFDDTGVLYTSGTGSAWNTISTGIIPGANFLGRSRMASAGPAIAIALDITSLWCGVMYSFDLGVTWNTWAFAGTNTIKALRGINGRLYALDGDTIWQSGQLALPDGELIV